MPAAQRHRPAGARLGDGEADSLAEAMAAFAAPSRLKLLFGLVGVERTVEELAAVTGLTPNVVSQQLRVLRLLRLTVGRRAGRHVRYRLFDTHVCELLEAIRNHGDHVRARDVGGRTTRRSRTVVAP